MAADLVPMVATVRIRAVIEKPFQGGRIQRLARGEDDGEMPVPQRVHVRTVGHEQLHHRDAISIERGSHQRSVAALVHVRPVLDHPPAMASLAGLGGSHGTRHSATHVSGPSLP